jgi:hypothetical protein
VPGVVFFHIPAVCFLKEKSMSDVQTEGLTFEKVWAMFQETDRRMKETDRKMQETDRLMKETGKLIGKLGNRFGEMVEHLILPSIKEKFNALGFSFDKTCKDIAIKDALDRYKAADIDIFLENGELAIAIEVKSKTSQNDVDRHKERMAVVRRWADRHNDNRKFYGAVAGAVMTEEVKEYALQNGFYVIVQSGDTVKIDIPDGFTPREW